MSSTLLESTDEEVWPLEMAIAAGGVAAGNVVAEDAAALSSTMRTPGSQLRWG